MTLWVGLTGGIGSGKSTVAARFASHGVPVLDADAIAHTLTAANGAALPAIRAHWGDAVFNAAGQLNRAALRQRVFADATQKQQLESLLHPLIFDAIQAAQQHTALPQGYGMVEIPLLTEIPRFRQLVQRILVVDVAEPLQIERVKQRSQLSDAAVAAIMAQQASRQQRLAIADDVLANHGDLSALHAAADQLHQYYTALGQP